MQVLAKYVKFTFVFGLFYIHLIVNGTATFLKINFFFASNLHSQQNQVGSEEIPISLHLYTDTDLMVFC